MNLRSSSTYSLSEILQAGNHISSTLPIGVGIGQVALQGPMARPTKSPAWPNSFNKWSSLNFLKNLLI